ncbi:WD40 repeat-like protein [Coniophora puteana RWD-64-598 SS2]|uniref:Pre-rRNA-processing protein IPI3 n=1 Tax=Coniophora puteana (strain RWD-64-598) TaxID=741705 RepID=A0A5M3MJV9_CONPW|nr:WD40 repeat-like protein [Coniophora puteana RWD-64-598 SS2]EIW79220.1 WD40 repeat-like protein [Coniophora puteana RWD-64-598 SS2]
MNLHEVVLCATAPAEGSSVTAGALTVHDIKTGTSLASFKQTNAPRHCNAYVETNNGQGGFMLAAQADKSILNVYNFQKDQLALKIVLPEKLSCIALDRSGAYCAGGTAQGRIYLWEVASGILFNAWDAHYRQVNVLCFSHDGSALFSGSEDSGVGVWSMARILDDELQNELVEPHCTLSDHTLPVTDIVCGIGAFPACRVLTASVDHTVKFWDLSSSSLLCTFHFPKPISTLVLDPTERLFFAASADGSVHQVNLFRERADRPGGPALEAVGGGGINDTIRIEDFDTAGGARRKRLISAGEPIASLALSLTTTLLLVGTAKSGRVLVYDVASHQLLRTISAHKERDMGVVFVSTMLRPPDLVGHVTLSMSAGAASGASENIPVRPIVPFQRMRDTKARDAHDVAVMLPGSAWEEGRDPPASYSYPEFDEDYARFVRPQGAEPAAAAMPARVAELESEVAKLREELGKAKGVNDAMWEAVVQRMVNGGAGSSGKEGGATSASEEGSRNGREGDGSSREGDRSRKRLRG